VSPVGCLKQLRTQAGWSQAELAEKIDSDGRQVSRYENGKITPSLEALVRITETFNITIDYFVIPDATPRPLHPDDHSLTDRLADLAHLTDDDRHILLGVIDSLTTKAKLRLLTGGGQAERRGRPAGQTGGRPVTRTDRSTRTPGHRSTR
jgi:transcriptional regulator with XRE-family HTH domain